MHHHKHLIYNYFLKSDLNAFYLTNVIRNLALAMVNIFIGIYIFNLRGNLEDVLIFYFFHYLAGALFFIFAGKLNSKIGTFHSIIISSPFLVIFFYILNYIKFDLVLLPLLAIFWSIEESLFWMSFHEEFSYISKSKKIGKESSLVRSIISLTMILGPLIGGVIISFLGFDYLFFVIIGLIFVCSIPMFFSKNIKPKQKFKFKVIKKEYKKHLFSPFVAYGASNFATSVIWPILFTIIPVFYELGLVAALVNFVAVIVTIYAGKKSDKISRKKLIHVSSFFYSISIFLRAFVNNIFSGFSIWVLGALSFPILSVALDAETYTESKHTNKLEFFVMREHAISLGRLLVICIAFFFVSNTMLALQAALIFAGLISFLFLLS